MVAVFSALYRFERLGQTAKTRIDCTQQAGFYLPFENRRTAPKAAKGAGGLVMYLSDPPQTFHRERTPPRMVLTAGGSNISSLYFDVPKCAIGAGDMIGTNDALLFLFFGLKLKGGALSKCGVMEIYIARGRASDRTTLAAMMNRGALNLEIFQLRETARMNKNSNMWNDRYVNG